LGRASSVTLSTCIKFADDNKTREAGKLGFQNNKKINKTGCWPKTTVTDETVKLQDQHLSVALPLEIHDPEILSGDRSRSSICYFDTLFIFMRF